MHISEVQVQCPLARVRLVTDPAVRLGEQVVGAGNHDVLGDLAAALYPGMPQVPAMGGGGAEVFVAIGAHKGPGGPPARPPRPVVAQLVHQQDVRAERLGGFASLRAARHAADVGCLARVQALVTLQCYFLAEGVTALFAAPRALVFVDQQVELETRLTGENLVAHGAHGRCRRRRGRGIHGRPAG